MSGDIIPAADKNWNLLVLLLQIMNVVFSPSPTAGMTVELSHLIAEHQNY